MTIEKFEDLEIWKEDDVLMCRCENLKMNPELMNIDSGTWAPRHPGTFN